MGSAALVASAYSRVIAITSSRSRAPERTSRTSSLRRIGIRIDDAHIDQTAEDFRSMMKTHRNVNRLVTGLGVTLVTGMFFGLLKLLGLNLAGLGGEH